LAGLGASGVLVAVAGLILLSACLTWLMIRVQLLAIPNERSSHDRPVPTSGGVGIVLATVAAALIYQANDAFAAPDNQILWVIVGSFILASGGLLDDVGRAKSFKAKLAFQTVGTIAALYAGVVFERIYLPFAGTVELGWSGYVLSALWIIGLTNAFNFMDGIDGIAGGTAVIASLFLCALGYLIGAADLAILAVVVGASTAGFLLFNFPKARIFMGDVGSQFLGYLFAVFGILAANAGQGGELWIVVPLLYFHFLFDTVFTFLRRWRAGEAVTLAHRSHLYQLLVRSGYSHPAVSGLHFLMSLALGAGALLVLDLHNELQFLVFAPAIVFQSLYLTIVLSKARRSGVL